MFVQISNTRINVDRVISYMERKGSDNTPFVEFRYADGSTQSFDTTLKAVDSVFAGLLHAKTVPLL